MRNEAQWSKELHDTIKNNPIYVAESAALDVATKINAALVAADLPKKEFARRLSVSQPYVSQILGGQTNMTILTLAKVACALGLELVIRMVPQPTEMQRFVAFCGDESRAAGRTEFFTADSPPTGMALAAGSDERSLPATSTAQTSFSNLMTA